MNSPINTQSASTIRKAFDTWSFGRDKSLEGKANMADHVAVGQPVRLQPVFGHDPKPFAATITKVTKTRFTVSFERHDKTTKEVVFRADQRGELCALGANDRWDQYSIFFNVELVDKQQAEKEAARTEANKVRKHLEAISSAIDTRLRYFGHSVSAEDKELILKISALLDVKIA